MSTHVPTLLRDLVDDAAVFPPGSAPLPDAVAAHRRHRTAWYRDLIGPLLLPASALRAVPHLLGGRERLAIGVIADAGVALEPTLDSLDERLEVRQVEVAVAKRGEDPLPGLRSLLDLLTARPPLRGYAEIPLAWGLMSALDSVAQARQDGVAISAKFRTGGLAAELFPSPEDLAAVICACRDRGVPFKLTAGLHHAVRYTDRHTGFTHHGFLNILVAAGQAADGAPVAEVARTLSTTDPAPLAEAARGRLDQPRPLWVGYGTCSISEPLDDLTGLGLVEGGQL